MSLNLNFLASLRTDVNGANITAKILMIKWQNSRLKK